MKHAPETLTALGSTRLITYHSAQKLHAALRSEDCWSCGSFGEYLHLPTCFRCCYRCLHRNQSLWVVPVAQACSAFGLSTATITKKLPVMRNLPGTYTVGWQYIRERRVQLVGVKAAKELALLEGKTEVDLAQLLESNPRVPGRQTHDYCTTAWVQRALIHPPMRRFPAMLPDANVPNDRLCGVASIPFPSMSVPNHTQRGLWCLGCVENSQDWPDNQDDQAILQLLGCEQHDMENELYRFKEIAWPEVDFLRHIAQCPGAKKVVKDLDTLLEHLPNA